MNRRLHVRRSLFLLLSTLAVLATGVFGVVRADSRSTPSVVPERIPNRAAFTTSIERTFSGTVWRAGVAVNGLGETCLDIRSPGGWQAFTCAHANVQEPIRAYTGGTREVGFLHGIAAPNLRGVKVVRSDCSTRELSVAPDGVFLDVYDPAEPTPYKVVGFDAVGEDVASFVFDGRGVSAPALRPCSLASG
jgi:hypothetical protein